LNVSIFPNIPDFLLERFVKFDNDFNGKSWDELYASITYLKSHYPNNKFDDVPFVYIDLANKKSGLIFIDRGSEELFFVYK